MRCSASGASTVSCTMPTRSRALLPGTQSPLTLPLHFHSLTRFIFLLGCRIDWNDSRHRRTAFCVRRPRLPTGCVRRQACSSGSVSSFRPLAKALPRRFVRSDQQQGQGRRRARAAGESHSSRPTTHARPARMCARASARSPSTRSTPPSSVWRSVVELAWHDAGLAIPA